MSERHIFRDIGSFEDRLGLPRGFYGRLLKEDDWSFVIKLNALFEGACAHALVARLNAPDLVEQFARLPFADRDTGKVKFLSTLGCISEDQSTFLRKLGELRNLVVHNVSKVGFTFDGYVAELDSNQRRQVAKVFGRGWSDPVSVSSKKVPLAKFAAENTKLVLWLSAAELLACLYLEFEIAEIRLRTAALDEYRKSILEPRLEALGP